MLGLTEYDHSANVRMVRLCRIAVLKQLSGRKATPINRRGIDRKDLLSFTFLAEVGMLWEPLLKYLIFLWFLLCKMRMTIFLLSFKVGSLISS